MLSCFSRVRLFSTPWTLAHQAPLSMGFSRQEYWSGMACPHALLQRVFLTRGWTHPSCVSCAGRRVLYHQHHLGLPVCTPTTEAVTAGQTDPGGWNTGSGAGSGFPTADGVFQTVELKTHSKKYKQNKTH